MALSRMLGTAVRHPLASTALAVGVAKGTLGVVRRLARGERPVPPTAEEVPTPVPTPTVGEPEVVPLEPEDRDLPEPVVIHAEDDPEPVADPEGHVELEEELVWTSESSTPPAAD